MRAGSTTAPRSLADGKSWASLQLNISRETASSKRSSLSCYSFAEAAATGYHNLTTLFVNTVGHSERRHTSFTRLSSLQMVGFVAHLKRCTKLNKLVDRT